MMIITDGEQEEKDGMVISGRDLESLSSSFGQSGSKTRIKLF